MVKEIAWEAADAIGERLSERIEERIALHQATCPVGKQVADAQSQFAGGRKVLAVIIGIAMLLSGIIGAAIGPILKAMQASQGLKP
jgi:hypothetical protein